MLLSTLPSPQPPWDSIFTPSLAGIYRLPVLPSQLLVLQGYAKMSDSFSSFFLNIDFSFLKHFFSLFIVCVFDVGYPCQNMYMKDKSSSHSPPIFTWAPGPNPSCRACVTGVFTSESSHQPPNILMMYTCNPSTGRPKKENFQFEASLGCIGSSRPASLCCRGRPCLKRT